MALLAAEVSSEIVFYKLSYNCMYYLFNFFFIDLSFGGDFAVEVAPLDYKDTDEAEQVR